MTLCFTCIYSTALASGQFPVTVMTSHAHPPMRWPHAAVTTTNKTSVSSLEAVADQHPAVSTSDLQSSTTACIDQWRVRCGDAFGQLPCRVAQDGQNHLKSRLWHSCVQRILLYTIQTTIRVSKALETLQVQHWEGPPHGLSLNAGREAELPWGQRSVALVSWTSVSWDVIIHFSTPPGARLHWVSGATVKVLGQWVFDNRLIHYYFDTSIIK